MTRKQNYAHAPVVYFNLITDYIFHTYYNFIDKLSYNRYKKFLYIDIKINFLTRLLFYTI